MVTILFLIPKSLEEDVGIAAVAISANTVATLKNVRLLVQQLPCKNFTRIYCRSRYLYLISSNRRRIQIYAGISPFTVLNKKFDIDNNIQTSEGNPL
ncbi:MAG: hypothetical protein ACXWFB_07865 [Nitrososphaeraceae archaeon]